MVLLKWFTEDLFNSSVPFRIELALLVYAKSNYGFTVLIKIRVLRTRFEHFPPHITIKLSNQNLQLILNRTNIPALNKVAFVPRRRGKLP